MLAGAGTVISGDLQSKVMFEVQPMKMAAAEALYETQQPAGFSVITIGTPDGERELWSVNVPGLLSFLATGSFDGKVTGINELQQQYTEQFGPGTYYPFIPLTYWSFRWMIGLGMAGIAVGALLLICLRGERRLTSFWWPTLLIALPLLPLFANSFGWIFTEMGRQPWVVFTPAADRRRGLADRVAGHGADVDDRLHRPVRGAGRGRGEAAAEVPAPRAARRQPAERDRLRRGRPPRLQLLTPTSGETEMELTTVWFVLIAVLWIGYFVLEGFDFGVGMLVPVLGKDDRERRVVINTIGPVWDGNEVWLLIAGGATFAAFPEWYATLFCGFYLPLLLILVALIVRGRRLRVPRQAARAGLAAALGLVHHHRLVRARPAVGRGLRQHRARGPAGRRTTTTSAASSTCSTRSRCSSGWSR